jgi:hypothetical protein
MFQAFDSCGDEVRLRPEFKIMVVGPLLFVTEASGEDAVVLFGVGLIEIMRVVLRGLENSGDCVQSFV